MWGAITAIPELGMWGKEDQKLGFILSEFKTSLGCKILWKKKKAKQTKDSHQIPKFFRITL